MIKQVFTVPVPVLVPVKAGTNKAIRSAFLISVSSWLLKHSSSASWLVEECHYLRPHRLWCKTTNWRAVVVAAGPTAIHLMHRGPIPSVYPLPRRGGGGDLGWRACSCMLELGSGWLCCCFQGKHWWTCWSQTNMFNFPSLSCCLNVCHVYYYLCYSCMKLYIPT